MPRHLVPHRSGVHRIAAIALYRALLSQCRALALELPLANELQNVVRNRFKQARHDVSIPRLRLSFEAGYEAIDHLDAAVAGNATSKAYILDLLQRAPSKAKQAPPIVLPFKLQKEINARKKREDREVRAKQDPPRPSLWDRPLPLDQLSGHRRRVPVLFNAAGSVGIPVLRLQKPQPTRLSGYIADRSKRRQAWANRRHRLFDELHVAQREDDWDGLVARLLRVNDRQESAWKWATEVKTALDFSTAQLAREKAKDGEMAARMQVLVNREMELAVKEKAEREEARRAKRRLLAVQRAQLKEKLDESNDEAAPG
ncbi:Hypothetical protein R9X50_00176200 [Acrodontium crateriforme]|uniref:Uncharacterized protein n=1 Tax=Acrodontium crateriforme TaxID=150365 RepID=A0AAQ3M309_9PEZI|nr:Hypothetical protein R9X50_00176200 [Acrodontium crateriforme]